MASPRGSLPLVLITSRKIILTLLLSASSFVLSSTEPNRAPEHAASINFANVPQYIVNAIPESTEPLATSAHGDKNHVSASDAAYASSTPLEDPLGELKDALEKMQSEYFKVWLGQWTATSDWTGAVMGTYVSASLNSLTRTSSYHINSDGSSTSIEKTEGQLLENYISRYFTQTSSYYFNENAFSFRTQAYDDMLWVVLGWLESVKFMNRHEELHYHSEEPTWHGKQFEPAFAHRSHIFYEIVKRGWDESLCGGGLTWNPRLAPYKNTITNTLFISASIGMYLYHPGDTNSSPFLAQSSANTDPGIPPAKRHGRRYLKFAVQAYDWLQAVNLTNSQGLYVDGYHIRNYGRNGSSGNVKCNLRNEMVYTYNQGVVLSGLRGLWESTGNFTYLEDGHRLVRNVIAATGWSLTAQAEPSTSSPSGAGASWRGLGRDGILQEFCDASATCSQDGQTFKGIFFNHLTLFCEPLPTEKPLIPGLTFVASPDEASLHARSCRSYTLWITRNARAALATKNEKGLFGMWWGAASSVGANDLPKGAVDVRNEHWILDDDPTWRSHSNLKNRRNTELSYNRQIIKSTKDSREAEENKDYNDRGRGRTVETQGGGLMVVRALWEFLTLYGG